MHARLIALVAIALLPAGAAAVTVYRCDDAGGAPVFQQQPCAGPGRTVDARPVNSPMASEPAAGRRRDAGARGRTATPSDARVAAVRDTPAPRRRPMPAACPSAREIRAERVSASSLTLSPAERTARERRVAEMQRCAAAGARRAGRR